MSTQSTIPSPGIGTSRGGAGAAPGGTWHADAATVQRALQAPCFVGLDELGIIEASGADAARFLQGQLTNRVEGLATDRLQLNGYCSPKGRLIATFHHWRDGDRHFLQLPREILPAVMKRLSMFVLRAKVVLKDATEDWCVLGAIGSGVEARLQAIADGGALPAGAWQATGLQAAGGRLVRVPASPRAGARFLVVARTDAIEAVLARCGATPSAPAPGAAWWWSEIDAGVPTVFAATQERYVPQMINFEVLGGVDFRKGCYPGQEVVARSQYRGALRRRMTRAHATMARAGDDVFSGSAAADEPIGSVVMAASAPDGGMDLLIECPSDRLADDALRVGSARESLAPRDLPYAITDPTA
ncbi:MAG TPA: folate-binding protein [Burkholderiaceae bacterium]|nr:folate-binding protein [Burkholderiaceae bacterium]